MKTILVKLLGMGLGLLASGLSAQPVITNQPASQTVIFGGNATFSVMATGIGPLTYQWQLNGTNLPNNIIATVAGNGVGTYAGDGGLATNASIFNSTGVAADGSGNFLIADRSSHRIRRVNTNGIIITVAGTNSSGFAGDSGAANIAKLNGPYGVAFDAWGNYFIADTGNNRIRKVDTNGVITTVAGNGTAGFGGDGAAATNASINAPRGVAVDGVGNLFIADTSNNRIRMVDTNGNITTLAGTNTAGFTGDGGLAIVAKLGAPQGVAVNGLGNVFIADNNNNRIRKVDATGIITTFAGTNVSGYLGDGGAATNARLANPTGVAVDGYGYVFFSDYNNNRIRQVDLNGIISTVAGNGATSYSGDGGVATNATLYQPYGVAVESGSSLLVADMTHSRIRRATIGRIPTLSFSGVTTNNAGNYQVIVTNPSGSVTSSVVSLTVVFVPSILTQPQSLAVSNGTAASLSVTVSGTSPFYFQWYQNNTPVDGGTNSVLDFPAAAFQQTGNYYCIITNNYGSVTSSFASFVVLTPPSIVTQPSNQILVAGNNTTFGVSVTGTGPFTYQWQFNGTNVSTNGIISTVAGSSSTGYGGDGGAATNAIFNGPNAVVMDISGNMLIADKFNHRIRKVDANGDISTIAGNGTQGFSGDGGAATNANLNQPSGVATDNAGNIFIADQNNYRVRKMDTNGIITTVAGNGSFGFSGDGGQAVSAKLTVTSVAVDYVGNLYIADSSNHRIRKVDTNGYILTVAGNGSLGNSGDDGPATSAKLNHPYGVALDNSGNLYISSTYAIRKVDANGLITTVAGTGTGGYSGDGGAATNATMWSAQGISLDAFGYIYIVDSTSYRVRQVDVAGIITTIAGNGSSGPIGNGGYATNAGLWAPQGVAVDNGGNILIADTGNNRIRKIITGRNPVLRLNNLSAKDAGNYQVIVSSPYGGVTSSVVSLAVLLPPSITTQPAYSRVVTGSSTNLSVAVSGDGPFGYQWFTSSGRTATAVPFVISGRVQFVSVTDSGVGYVSTPQVHFIGGSGSGATATASMMFGTVSAINVNNQGSGYGTAAPTIQIDPPPTINAPLPNQTDAILPLTSVTSMDATNYFVVITNNYGSVTSSTVFLTVFLPPQNFTIQNVVTGLQMNLTGSPFYPYVLQSTTNLAPPTNWKSIRTNYSDANGNWTFIATNISAAPNVFYRTFAQ